jgi:hypothetical protein
MQGHGQLSQVRITYQEGRFAEYTEFDGQEVLFDLTGAASNALCRSQLKYNGDATNRSDRRDESLTRRVLEEE